MIFDEAKATQVAAKFLKLAGGRIRYLALIKLLYKLDRLALKELGLPVTTDKYASLRLGPVTSNIYNLIKSHTGAGHPSFWGKHIKTDGYDAHLVEDPGDSELSRAEEALINRIFSADGSKSGFKLADECHQEFPEWTDPGASSVPIRIEDILKSIGATEEEIGHVESLISAQRAGLDLSV